MSQVALPAGFLAFDAPGLSRRQETLVGIFFMIDMCENSTTRDAEASMADLNEKQSA